MDPHKIQFFLTESSFSHDQIRDMLTRALNPGGDADMRCWPREVYDDYVIYADGEHLYRRAYAIDADGMVTLGDRPAEVVQQTSYVPVSESRNPGGVLLESADAEGWNWRIQVIQSGVSANGNEYPLSVLHEAAPVYAGVPVFAGRGPDHSPTERGFESVAGYIAEPRPSARGVEATFEINRGRADIREAIRHAYDVKQRTGRDAVGFSHVIPRGGAVTEARIPHGRRVTRITRAESVDLVMSPAAGGALLAPLQESTSGQPDSDHVFDALQEAIMNVEAVLARLRAGADLSPEEETLLEASVTARELTEARAAGAAAKSRTGSTATRQAEPTQASPDATLHEARIRELEESLRRAECRAILTARLAESRLPEPMRTAISADYDGRIFEAAELDARITRDRDIAGQLVSVRPHGLGDGIAVTEDQRDKHQKAMDGLVWGQRRDGVQPFLTLKEAYQAISGDYRHSYISGELPRRILAEAISYAGDDTLLAESITTSTFGDVLGDSIRRRMLAEYGRPDRQTWRPIVRVEPVVDFRTVERTRWGGYGLLPTVPQGGTYQSLTSPGDEKATDSLDKYGGLEDLTLETIANDDMGLVRRIPVKMGYAAADTLYAAVFNTTILGNVTASYDSVALYHASHSNTGTTALGETGLSAVETAMRDQLEYGNQSSLPLGEANMPKFLLIPNELRVTAHKLTQGPNAVISAETATTPNFFNGRYQVIVVDDWTDATDWYAFADPNLSPVLEVGFYQGREEPEMFVQDAQTVGSVFTADKVTYKIRHIWYVMVVDHRGTYRQVVA
ncbi:MAG: hypothetical protein NAOJABEB_02970 [Steroidobacteraceae bacterium]|nr:hypothetical protein [Steroidobacteraceae bacterium]